MTYPKPFNPSNAHETPGYRFLGIGEQVGEYDTTFGPNGWGRSCCRGQIVASSWLLTNRRPLCVDDQYAPAPSEWLTPGYQVMGPVAVNCYSPSTDEQHWWGGGWTGSTPGSVFGFPVYVRRKTQASAPSAPTLNAKREVVVYIGDSAALSNMLKAIFKTDTPTCLYAGYVLIRGDEIYGCNVDSGAYRSIHYVGVIWIDAYTEMSKLVDLLPSLKTPAPVAPTINGYSAQYTKGSSTVTFGCAQISIELIKGMKGALNTIEAYGPYRGNRFMTGFVLNSGVKLGREDVKSILAYVDQVNGANAPQS